LAGAVITTSPDTGVGVGAATVLVGTGVTTGVGVTMMVGVEVGPPLFTVTFTAAVPATTPALLKAVAEIVWLPLGTVVEFQLKLLGGVEAK
jgi:hypothetical protein